MKRIILDTNFLLIPYQFKVDIFAELERICDFNFEVLVLDKTIEELDKIMAEQKGKHRDAARLAKQLIQKKKVKIIRTEKTASLKKVDQFFFELADKDNIIATQDKKLKVMIKQKGFKVILLKQKSYLEFG